MKRRRHTLQVSTFPFLAVLLCAMGSLILLLLVIDRRAKVVMRAKALAAIRQMETEDANDSAARAAEWEERRRALHEQLQRQKQELDSQSASLDKQLTDAAHEIQAEQAQTSALGSQLQAEKENLLRVEDAVASAVREANQKKQQSEAASAELTRMSSELIKLEQTVEDLKTLRQRQKQTYSLVPYRGRRGDNRRPIYLECTKEALIFHPDRLILPATDSSGSAILDEVERRINRQQPAGGSQSEKKGIPYLLLLVRPNGIVTYYRTLAALRNVKTDFGYEFVESDWVLDFPENEKAIQPWMVAGSASAESEVHQSSERTQKSPQPVTAQVGSGGLNVRESAELARTSPSLSGTGVARPESSKGVAGSYDDHRPIQSGEERRTPEASLRSPATGGGNSMSRSLGSAASGGGGSLGSVAGGGGGSLGSVAGGGGDSISRSLGSAASRGGDTVSGSPGNAASGGSDTGTNSQTRGHNENSPPQLQGLPGFPDGGDLYRFRHFASLPASMGIDRLKRGEAAATGSEGQGVFPASPTISGNERSGGTPGLGQPRGVAFAATRGAGGTNPSDDQGQSQSVGNIGQRDESSPRFPTSPLSGSTPFNPDIIGERAPSTSGNGFSSPSPGLGTGDANSLSKSAPPDGAAARGSSSTGTPSPPALIPTSDKPPSPGSMQSGSPSGDVNRAQSSEPGDAEPQLGSSSALNQLGAEREKKSGPAPIVRRYVRPEWNIFIECTNDHVIVYPGGLQIPANSLGGHGKVSQSLLPAIQQMIAHRQAVIASSEPDTPGQPPQIRFLVRPDGLRTYFLAYPELAPLHLSMTRENLDAKEDAVRHMMGR